MARYDFASHRLFVDYPLAAGTDAPVTREQANYLLNVLRMAEGAKLLVFNGRDGEWRAELRQPNRRTAVLHLIEQTRPQTPPAGLRHAFAPLKAARLDYLVQKAVEMGAGRLAPVITQRTQVSRLKAERLAANAIEAAEQCGILALPEIEPETRLPAFLAGLAAEELLVFADEDAEVADPLALLTAAPAAERITLLIGPEGGFTAEERAAILKHPRLCRLSLGPRILRADTAAVAALALVQAVRGDWRSAG
ncbi:MAG: 16S rRNA (uracil(1498)-N(3))-methyltransferase [Hyphomicrobiales bacterium]|uniref:16S rRNA (uracil(1498)-N(3))-methyltransferase n=1 Tax=Rhabdaerophilum calidifontis TaxID=2604328 RepID=UPI0012396BE0|nr:16S rRNA (uracil(1498)-N(3))-methyltransferase [Rhabdaerophilum calidifontis]MCA1953474.1 16S rRNA (uracil(1498)-N(3))-methyltransferase [Hyphomicrobiales bacterium]